MSITAVSAIATLGPSSSGTPINETGSTGTYGFTVQFGQTFTTAPIVLVTLLQGSGNGTIPDTFGIVVTSVTTSRFTVNVNRIDELNNGWGQSLQLQYVAFTPS